MLILVCQLIAGAPTLWQLALIIYSFRSEGYDMGKDSDNCRCQSLHQENTTSEYEESIEKSSVEKSSLIVTQYTEGSLADFLSLK